MQYNRKTYLSNATGINFCYSTGVKYAHCKFTFRKNYIHMSMCSSRGPQVMTSTQTSSQPTRRKSVYERFIKCVLWKFVLKISFQLKLNLLVYNRRACTRQLLEKIKQSFSLFFFFELQQENHNSSTNASHLIFFHFKCQSTISIYVLGKWKRSV